MLKAGLTWTVHVVLPALEDRIPIIYRDTTEAMDMVGDPSPRDFCAHSNTNFSMTLAGVCFSNCASNFALYYRACP